MTDDVMRWEEADRLMDEYILKHIEAEPEYLKEVHRLTNLRLAYSQMCSGHLQGRLLKMLCRLTDAHRVLELGTFSGYATLSLAEGMTPDSEGNAPEIDTIEIFDELEDFLREVFAGSPLGKYIRLHIGDALEILPALKAGYDLCFMDADKRLYPLYYNKVIELMRPGGLIVADNTLWGGKVVQPVKPSDTQTQGILAFNDMVAADDQVETVILPLRDGLTLIRKKEWTIQDSTK